MSERPPGRDIRRIKRAIESLAGGTIVGNGREVKAGRGKVCQLSQTRYGHDGVRRVVTETTLRVRNDYGENDTVEIVQTRRPGILGIFTRESQITTAIQSPHSPLPGAISDQEWDSRKAIAAAKQLIQKAQGK